MAKRKNSRSNRATEGEVDELTRGFFQMLQDVESAEATKALATFAKLWKRMPREQSCEMELAISACAAMGEVLTAFATGLRSLIAGQMPDIRVGREIHRLRTAAVEFAKAKDSSNQRRPSRSSGTRATVN